MTPTTVATAADDRLLVCTGTPDDPADWTARTALEGAASGTDGGGTAADRFRRLAASPDAPDRLFAGTFGEGLVRSESGGDPGSWERLETPFVSDDVMSLTVSPHDPDVVYAGTEPSRVYRSTDGGDSWAHLEGLTDLPSADEWYFPPRPDTHHVRWLEVDPFDPERLYVGIEAGAFVLSADGGATWRDRPEGSRLDNHSLATHPDREGRVYAAAGDGYAESDDGGETWRRPQAGLEHTYCWSVVPDPGDPDAIIVSSARGASSAHRPARAESYVYRRVGAPDASWDRLDGNGFPTGEGVVRATFATTGEPGVVYGVTNRGLFVTTDFGDSWARLELEGVADDALESAVPHGLVAVRRR
ncbi:hypothetical protein ACFQGT_19205 [Natrialbaceae archaeon GCM10025810]|uniref:hypothetical protein n=1 Tax=Halovalidus salilacus TaxID=3075124 RepID=UPI0036239F65